MSAPPATVKSAKDAVESMDNALSLCAVWRYTLRNSIW